MSLPDDWADFADECAQRVAFIESSKDEGVYAKLYARDVGKLLRMLARIDNAGDLDQDLLGIAYDRTQ